MSEEVALGPGREFDLIRSLLARWGPLATGVGDDAAVLAPPAGALVLSADSSVEDVHFRREWLTPHEIGRRATTAALSDLAAMAATPIGVLLSLSIPERWLPDVPALADGIGEAVGEADARILGGDITRAGELTIAVTVVGSAARPLRRDAARPGDTVYVTGALGGPLAAVRAWERGQEPSAADRERFARPRARIREARWLAEHGAAAAVDISDGLVADLAHVAHASRARITVHLDRLPLCGGVAPEDAARSGEEYELAVTARAPIDTAAFARTFGVALTAVGSVHEGAGAVEVMHAGARVAAPPGWDHFS